jgi:hypothetical protein
MGAKTPQPRTVPKKRRIRISLDGGKTSFLAHPDIRDSMDKAALEAWKAHGGSGSPPKNKREHRKMFPALYPPYQSIPAQPAPSTPASFRLSTDGSSETAGSFKN